MPGEIDLIVGADLCGHLFLGEKRIASLNEPVACRTPFGWVLMGPVDHVATTTKNSHLVTVTRTPTQFSFENFWDVTDVNPQMKTKNLLSCSIQPNLSHDDDCLSNRLQRFWEMEELPDETPLTEEEKQCEEFYRETYARDSTGRFTVRLPFRLRPHENLSHNKQAAASMQISNERKAASNQAFKEEYQKFMAIYAELEHMKMITSNTTQGTFLPHHGVYRTLPSPKFRVVFNASFKTLQGMSLNQCLMPGQKLQSEPWVIITRARRYRIAFTADIIKMFRQIKVHPEDTKWQQILWRPEPTMQMQAFELTTVTYGTASAPYLALRTLLQLAEDEHKNFPLGARAIRESSYVDDFFTGGDTVEAALEMKTQLTGILKTGGFELSKWASNTPELIFKNDRDEKQFEFDTITTLGLVWNPTNDKLSLKINMADFRQDKPTKRVVLSDVSRLFDPLGWFSPVLIVAKILIQDLWLLGVDWDGPLPSQLTEQWETFKLRLPLLETIGIPRWLGASINSDIELHVFNDASERAYSAAVYMRVLDSGVSSITRLVVAKTKVAPVKTLSVPRLELCGALLGARLVDQVRKKLELTNTSTFAWIDSQVTLAWIKAHASRWSSFVANRVSKIQSILKPSSWRHVKTHENPADLATRGITPHELEASSLWWTGPHWLSDPLYSLDQSEMVEATYLEQKRSVQALHVTREVPLFDRYSEFKKLVRITAYCLRYIRNSKLRHSPKKLNKKGRTLPLSTNELTAAQRQLIRVSQRKFFADEIHALQKQIKIPVNSPIRSLRPFIDEDGVIRVGGRLQRADLNFEEKHPIILQKDCRLSYLIMREAHIKTMHGGPQLSISHAIRTYWITHIQTLAKQVYRECVVCTRFAARTLTQIMGNLPKFRVNSLRPFMACGVDYAGPILLRATKGRGYRAYKGYISVFVCLTTKAVHLEAVSDLSTPGFLAAFRRFISRRGRVQTMVSDNGSNFHGADKELREMFSEASEFYKKTCVSLVEDGTDWSFIPPSAPHMGGIWEAAVKSTKYHLKRVIGDTTLTFEEMTTLLCQIEACLNSRPLMEISNHPDDLALLTPGHFLIGHALTVLPESGTIDFNLTPVKRYERLTSMRDDFWRRWKAEYLSTLQTRKRWCDPQKDLPLGSLVLIKDENTPTAKWPLARVVRVNPGPDGHVRAVTVKTATKEYDRPIHKLCWLPVPLKEDQKTKEEER